MGTEWQEIAIGILLQLCEDSLTTEMVAREVGGRWGRWEREEIFLFVILTF